MAISNFIPEIWTNEALDTLKNQLVAERVADMSYNSDVVNDGDTIHILKHAAIADAAYPASSNITYSALSDGTSDLSINTKRYFAFEVPDLDKAQARPEFVTRATANGAYDIADHFDALLLAEYANASVDSYETGSTAWQFTLATCADIPPFFASIVRQLQVANAPSGQAFVIGPPQLGEAINTYFGGKATDRTAILANGFKGNFFGVNVYISNNCTTASSVTHGLAGIEGQTTALVYQLKKTEALRLEGRFSDGVRMLVVGGIKTYRPEILIDVNLNSTVIATS